MNKLILINLLFFLTITACSSGTKLSERGEKIKLVELLQMQGLNCKDLGALVHVTKFKYLGLKSGTIKNDLKNLVGQTNANVGATDFNLNPDLIPTGSRIVVRKYLCPKNTFETLVGIE